MSDHEGRVFLRGITSETYGLAELRRRQRAAPRIPRPGAAVDRTSLAYSDQGDRSRAWWVLGPVHQHYNADPAAPLVLLSAQNRLFKLQGYNAVVYLEDAPEYAGRPHAAGGARTGM